MERPPETPIAVGPRSSPSAELRCPFCHDRVSRDAGRACGACAAVQHTACWKEHARCAACAVSSRAPGPAHSTFTEAASALGISGAQLDALLESEDELEHRPGGRSLIPRATLGVLRDRVAQQRYAEGRSAASWRAGRLAAVLAAVLLWGNYLCSYSSVAEEVEQLGLRGNAVLVWLMAGAVYAVYRTSLPDPLPTRREPLYPTAE